jgi:hypothetical protein
VKRGRHGKLLVAIWGMVPAPEGLTGPAKDRKARGKGNLRGFPLLNFLAAG